MAETKAQVCSFNELFSLKVASGDDQVEIKRVVIPMVQRDYAQGRNTEEIKRIRAKFLDSLYDAVIGEPIDLDFIYGDIDDDGLLTPLDGQQRLTTLFLLYWYAAKKDRIDREEYKFLSRFSYETRFSARDFCRYLVEFDPLMDGTPISKEIVDQTWFPLSWKKDQTVRSMLVMIDEIQKKFRVVSDLWLSLTEKRKITFNFLPIKDMGLTDELYIKMNSRGKLLTIFENFKADLEHRIEKVDESIAERIERKIDGAWTDFLWTYRYKPMPVDNFFINYFKFLCDVICYENGDSPLYRSYDVFDLLDIYFDPENEKFKENMLFIEKAFDCWQAFGSRDGAAEVFYEFLSTYPGRGKVVVSNRLDGLSECIFSYSDKETGKRSRSFSLGKFVMLYAFLQYVLNKNEISKDDFKERIRIVNNLIMNSDDEMKENFTDGGYRMPYIIRQTKSIILTGEILDRKKIEKPSFNSYQLEEEIIKKEWRRVNPGKVESLNSLEDHCLLSGQIAILGLENHDLFDGFEKLFTCNRDIISCALLTFGDYSRGEKYWRYQFGMWRDESWKFLFHKNASSNFSGTKQCMVSLLRSGCRLTDSGLKELIEKFIAVSESKNLYDWRYYFIKYCEFRPQNTYGRYWIKGGTNHYEIYSLKTQWKVSENAFQLFLKVIDESRLDRDNMGQRLVYGENYLYCEKQRFVLKDGNGRVLRELRINQNEDGIDVEDRIKKYKSTPLA